MKINNAMPVGTVLKLKEANKRVSVIGVMQEIQEGNNIIKFDYIGVPYPEGFLGTESMILFQESDIESIYAVGYSDIERQKFISDVARKIEESDINNKLKV